jgi:CheY-like chemotaxis protein/multidrug efflux pump subunit AcrA (membrane-fusion protein)
MNASTILLVDDDEVLGQVLRRVLTRQGYTVLNASTVAQAEQLTQQHRPQLGLLDLCLPDGDGVELARRLTEKSENRPLILLTAYPLRLRERPELAAKFSRVLTKPVNLQELRNAIESALTEPKQDHVSAQNALSTSAAGSHLQEPAPAVVSAVPEAISTAAPPSRRNRWYFIGLGIAAASVLLMLFAGWKFGLFQARPVSATTPSGADEEGKNATRSVPRNSSLIALKDELVNRLDITTAEVVPAKMHPPLELSGWLALDTNKESQPRSPSAGVVLKLATVPDHAAGTSRPLRIGDFIKKDEMIAVIYSAEFGQKKRDLADALAQLAHAEAALKQAEDAGRNGDTKGSTLLGARRAVEQSRIKVQQAESSLRNAKMTDAEIEAMEKQLRNAGKPKELLPDSEQYKEWASFAVKAHISGTIVAKNVSPGDKVDTTTDLVKIIDLSRLLVWGAIREEDMPVLQLQKLPLGWTVTLTDDANVKPFHGELVHISPVVDATRHTAYFQGYVANTDGQSRDAQPIKATVAFAQPKNAVEIPAAALVEDGGAHIVVVKPDSNKNEFVLKRVKVVNRYPGVVQISNDLTAEEAKAVDENGLGLEILKAGERVVVQNAADLKATLDSLRTKTEP